MKRRIALTVLLLFMLCLAGCDNAEPEIVGTPTPGPTSTPEPAPFTLAVTGAPAAADQLGSEIVGEDHYTQYLSFGDIRVYEYGTDTFLDGIAVNAYPVSLDTEIRIAYYDKDGKLIGRGTLHDAEGNTAIPSGSSRVYAEIATDVDVRLLDFALEYVKMPAPAEG